SLGANFTLTSFNNITYETVFRPAAATPSAGRIFTYDPAVDTNGIRIGLGFVSGTNPGYTPTDIVIGIEGQIVNLG
ncbi:MAG TPA: hypothetical protein VK890_07110, partial [Bacteroidia bacterium]|nr:hypothetical protein [Bacteroidia bacterium]